MKSYKIKASNDTLIQGVIGGIIAQEVYCPNCKFTQFNHIEIETIKGETLLRRECQRCNCWMTLDSTDTITVETEWERMEKLVNEMENI